ncbi:phosphohistidine phosphatase SixA [Gilliamella sp. wkB108]|uniref:phosphohistidine phosphatase SixA n=1 Tax=Gilliamella sp. wkB108 TaxID=3120256 RepID=UPI00159EC15F|nr:phosphohistidine phosphatase SixA [Gilliamella apicola]
MRHGEAGFSASSDSSRSLTKYGCEQASKAGLWLRQQNFQFDLGLVSPYIRAQQTLEQLSSHASIFQVETNKALVPGGDPAQVVNRLIESLMSNIKSVIVVSHLPLVGYLVNELCPDVSPPMFATAAIACIDLSSDVVGKLEWFHQAG